MIVDKNIIRAAKSRRWLYNQVEIQMQSGQEPPTELTGVLRKERDEEEEAIMIMAQSS